MMTEQGAAGAPGVIDAITSVHFILIALLAAVVIVALLFAIRLRARGRRERAAAIEQRAQGADPLPVDPPTAPEPPPLADTPIPAAAPLDAAPATVAASDDAEPAAPPAPGGADDLTQLKGVGPKLAAQLAALGYTRFAQIAALSPAEADALDAQLGTFKGRLTRDRWIEQAGLLAKGDKAGFEERFGKL